MAEKYYSISPYAYVLNNPLKYIDTDGRQASVAIKSARAATQPSKFKRMYGAMKAFFLGTSSTIVYNHYVDGDLSESVANHLITTATVTTYGTWQEQQDRKTREALDLAQAKVAQAIHENMPSPNWDNGGGSDPKNNRNYSLLQRLFWGTIGVRVGFAQIEGAYNGYQLSKDSKKEPKLVTPAPITPVKPGPIPAPGPISPAPIKPVPMPMPAPAPPRWIPPFNIEFMKE